MRSLEKRAGRVLAPIMTILGINHAVVFGAGWNEISTGLCYSKLATGISPLKGFQPEVQVLSGEAKRHP